MKGYGLGKGRRVQGLSGFFLCREVMVGSAGGWRRGVAKEAKNGSRGEVSSGLGEGAERVIVFRVICVLGFLCDSP